MISSYSLSQKCLKLFHDLFSSSISNRRHVSIHPIASAAAASSASRRRVLIVVVRAIETGKGQGIRRGTLAGALRLR